MNRKIASGFTIVELLVVIVIIGILVMISIVSYQGIARRAGEVAVQSELSNASKSLSIYYAQNGSYPTSLDVSGCPAAPVPSSSTCLRSGSGIVIDYDGSTNSYGLKYTKSDIAYKITDSTGMSAVTASNCPAGYIIVPGSSVYGTSDFCVMKYEAKNVSGVATSTFSGTPWVSISQSSAITTSAAACTGCHLITEAEWMTLARNVLSVASNWSGGNVGSGYIYSGHCDDNPSSAITADSNDSNGYANTNNTSGNQRRTLTLSNGEVIWDMAGDVLEWTSGRTSSGVASQPGVAGNAYASWVEWPSLNVAGSLAVNVTPAGTGLSGAGSWVAANGIGKIISSPAETLQYGIVRGGRWNYGVLAGVLSIDFSYLPSVVTVTTGFRVTK